MISLVFVSLAYCFTWRNHHYTSLLILFNHSYHFQSSRSPCKYISLQVQNFLSYPYYHDPNLEILITSQSYIEFVRNSCLVISGFKPVKFFVHFQFKGSARAFATNVLKETVEVLKEDDDEKVKEWARRFATYDYQVTANWFLTFTSNSHIHYHI